MYPNRHRESGWEQRLAVLYKDQVADNQILQKDINDYEIAVEIMSNQLLNLSAENQKNIFDREEYIAKLEQENEAVIIANDMLKEQQLMLFEETEKKVSDEKEYSAQLEQTIQELRYRLSIPEPIIIQRKTSRELKHIGDFNNAPKRRRNN